MSAALSDSLEINRRIKIGKRFNVSRCGWLSKRVDSTIENLINRVANRIEYNASVNNKFKDIVGRDFIKRVEILELKASVEVLWI